MLFNGIWVDLQKAVWLELEGEGKGGGGGGGGGEEGRGRGGGGGGGRGAAWVKFRIERGSGQNLGWMLFVAGGGTGMVRARIWGGLCML